MMYFSIFGLSFQFLQSLYDRLYSFTCYFNTAYMLLNYIFLYYCFFNFIKAGKKLEKKLMINLTYFFFLKTYPYIQQTQLKLTDR